MTSNTRDAARSVNTSGIGWPAIANLAVVALVTMWPRRM